jgi:hypothetical protein
VNSLQLLYLLIRQGTYVKATLLRAGHLWLLPIILATGVAKSEGSWFGQIVCENPSPN